MLGSAIARWVADRRLRSLFCVARRCSVLAFPLVSRIAAGQGVRSVFMACKRSGVRIPIAPQGIPGQSVILGSPAARIGSRWQPSTAVAWCALNMPVIAMLWLGIGRAWLGRAGGAVGACLPRVPVPAGLRRCQTG